MKFKLILCLSLGVIPFSGRAHLPEETTATGTSLCTQELDADDYGQLEQQGLAVNPIELGAHNGKAFSFGRTNMSWVDSLTYCYVRGLIPASVEDKEDFKFLSDKFMSLDLGSHFWFWTSGNDLATPRHFTWFQSRLPLQTDPGIKLVLNDRRQRCLIFEIIAGVKIFLNDYNCEKEALPLCERRSSS